MRQFSLFAIVWCVTTLCIATAVNLKSRSSQAMVFQRDVSEVTIYKHGFPIEYDLYIPAYQKLFWTLANSAVVLVPSFVLFRASRWLTAHFGLWTASEHNPDGS
jgi:hypothetical protein